MVLVDSALVFSVGGGLLARQLRFAVFGPPDNCPRPVMLETWGWGMPLVEPELRIPPSPELCAAWAAGALVAQALVLLTRKLFTRIRGDTSLRVRRIGAARVDLCSSSRGGRGQCYTHRSPPDAVAGLALEAVLRRSGAGTAVVVVNV